MPLVNEGIKMKLLYCVIYYIVLGVCSFLLGRILPKGWFNSRAFPYKPLDFEAGLYKKLRVKQWQNTLPDMSRILPKFIPPKKMTADYGSKEQFLDTATLYLQRVMQLVAGGFLYASITASDHGKFI